jgi:hypothetical protein
MILFLWYLISSPYDRLICQIWTEQINRPGLVAACGDYVADHAADYIAVVTGGCTTSLATLEACDYAGRPVRVYQPGYAPFMCLVRIDHEGEPTQAEIAAQCPYDALHAWQAGRTTWQGPYQQEPDLPPAPTCQLAEIPTGPGIYDQPADLTALATAIDYQVLAYNLRWYGFYQISVVDWQNQWDEAILRAAVKNNIPARALKAIIAQESQFWPHAVGPGDEWGLIQLSEDGADVALHYSPALFARYCPIAGWGPCLSYRLMSTEQQANIRYVLRADLRLDDLEINRAVRKSLEHIPTYAAILAAYRCHTLTLVPGASWDVTLAAYNAGGECIKSGQVCPEGLEYIRKVKP